MGRYRPLDVLGGSQNVAHGFTTTAVTLLSAASNTSGAILRTLEVAGGNNIILICAGTAAPSSFSDTSDVFPLMVTTPTGHGHAPTVPILIPAGMGIFAIASGSASNNYAGITYDLL